MKILANKAATAVSLLLMFAMAVSLVALPAATAQADYRTKKTHAMCGLMPNPVGVGQEVLVWVAITDYVENQSCGWEGLTVTVERPDGTTETLGPFRTDATGGTGTVYVPGQVGNYTFQTHFPAQWFNWTIAPMFDPEIYGNIWYEASDSEKVTLVVQEEPIPEYPATPLPTEYWTRPINAQHYTWNTISANWLGIPSNSGFGFMVPVENNDDAPESPHILWTKPLSTGGLSGGFLGDHSAETGDAYEGKFVNTVILNGILYYNRYAQGFMGGWNQQGIYAVDLRTGEELWFKNNSRIAFGQTLYWDSFNMHGVFSYIYESVTTFDWMTFTSSTTWKAYDPLTGEYQFSISNIPSSGEMFGASYTQIGPKGEIIIYNIDLAHGWVAKWNSTLAVRGYTAPGDMDAGSWGSWANTQRTFDGTQGYEWNKTLSAGAGNLPGVVTAVLEDRVVGCTAGGFTSIGERPVVIWSFSLESTTDTLPLLYNTTWQPPTGDLSISYGETSLEDKVFTIKIKETRQIYGFNLDTGQKIWGPSESQAALDIYGFSGSIAYGKLLSTGYGGILYCYDVKTGELLWTYEATDPYNEILWSTNWPIFVAFITDGKIYLQHSEHSPVNPLPRGAPFICIDIETGEKLWEIPLRTTNWGGGPVIGDSIIALWNSYDSQIYALGKGPSATSVAASPKISVHGDSVLVEGMVTDISSGTKEYALTTRFPNGVPAVSDENMSAWMEYVYMQFPRPTDVVGVEVTISVLDPNNNVYDVGTATSDASGTFCCEFTPEVPGLYTVIATFAGSDSYWPSYAETYLKVNEAPAATPEPTPTPAPMTDTYVLGTGIAIIIAIVIGFALLLLRKR
jgi:outer membrane protein assembly factor BamB